MGKIFVGGLNWDTSDENFKNFFAAFGEIEEAMVMRDRASNTSRGFGFVTFKDSHAVDAVLKAGDLELDSRKVDCKAAVPKEQITSMGGPSGMMMSRTKKIFVGGLLPETTEAELKEYFGVFGHITEALIMMDHHTNRSRGFGFVSFESEDSVEKVCAVTLHELGGKTVECKKAVPKQKLAGFGPAPTFGMGGKGGGKGAAIGVRGGKGGGFGAAAYAGAAAYGGVATGAYGAYGAAGYGAAARPAYGAYGAQPAYAPAPTPQPAATPDYYRGYGGYEAGAPAVQQPEFAAYGGYEQGAGAYDAYGAAAAAGSYGAYEAQSMRSTRGERSYHPYR